MKMKEYKHTWMMSKWLVLSLVQVVVLLMDIVTCEKAEKIMHEKKQVCCRFKYQRTIHVQLSCCQSNNCNLCHVNIKLL